MWIPRAEINNSDTYRCKGNRDLYLKSTTLYTLLFAFTSVFPPHVSCSRPKEGEWGSWNGRQEVKSSTRESSEKQRVWHVSRDARKSSLAWEMHALAEARPKKKVFSHTRWVANFCTWNGVSSAKQQVQRIHQVTKVWKVATGHQRYDLKSLTQAYRHARLQKGDGGRKNQALFGLKIFIHLVPIWKYIFQLLGPSRRW